MTGAKRKKKGRGFRWRWLEVVMDTARSDDGGDRPALLPIYAVSQWRLDAADPDGGSCYPSQTSIATRLAIKRDTVVAVDRWLQDNGLMKFVRNRAYRVKEYRLVVPDGGQRDNGQLSPVGDNGTGSVVPPVVPSVVPVGGHNLLPPNEVKEEEGSAGATTSPPAALPSSLTDADVKMATEVAGRLVDASDRDVNQPDVITALAKLHNRYGWPWSVVEHRASVVLAKSDGRNPAAFLANGLGRVRPQALTAWERFAIVEDTLTCVGCELAELLGNDEAEHLLEECGDIWLESKFEELFPDWGESHFGPTDYVRNSPPEVQRQAERLALQALDALTQHRDAVRAQQEEIPF